MNIPVLLLEATIAMVPLVLIKKYVNTKNNWLLFFSLLCYMVMIWCYIVLFKTEKMSTVYTLIHIIQVIIAVFIGVLYFHEKLSFVEVFGVILGLTSMYLLLLNNHSF